MTTPTVTVVLPVYNAASTITATIASVLAQSFGDLELVIIDDGSTDDSLHRLLPIAASDERIRLVSRRNGGVASARNLGVELSAARFIAFIDADDIWAAEKLARHLERHRADPMLVASYARIGFLPSAAQDLSACRTLSTPLAAPLRLVDVLGENPVCTMSNLFVRRDRILDCGGFDITLSHAEDQELVARLIACGGRVEAVDALLVGYRFSPGGLSMDLERMKAGWQTVAARYLGNADRATLEALYLRYLARRALRSGGLPRAALGYALEGLRSNARAFLADHRRGFGTLAGALVAPLLPGAVRRHVFA